VLSVIDLDGDSSFGMAFIPQWIKNTSAFGLIAFWHPTIIWIVPWKRMVYRMRWHLPSLRHVFGQTRRLEENERKKNLMGNPKDL
jgi:hypothetical protein